MSKKKYNIPNSDRDTIIDKQIRRNERLLIDEVWSGGYCPAMEEVLMPSTHPDPEEGVFLSNEDLDEIRIDNPTEDDLMMIEEELE